MGTSWTKKAYTALNDSENVSKMNSLIAKSRAYDDYNLQ